MNLIRRILFPAIVATGVSWAPFVQAQDPGVEPSIDDIALLSDVINWVGIARAVAFILIAWLLLSFADRIIDALGRSIAERRFQLQRFKAFFHFFIYVTTFVLLILYSFEFSPQVLALFGGAAVVAVGFATRDLLASLVAGVLIIFDRPFQVGDRVKFGDEYGDIQKIGLRSIKLLTLDDSTVTIPNNRFLNDVVSSSNSGELEMLAVVDFYVGLDQDVNRGCELIQEAAVTSRYIYLPNPIRVQASQKPLDGYVAMRLRLKAYVLDTKYESDFKSDITLRVHGAFADHHILPPVIMMRLDNS